MTTEQRIEALEWRLAATLRRRRLASLTAWAAIGVMLIAAAWPSVAAEAPEERAFEVVTAEAFQLVDQRGRVRAVMAADGEDVSLEFLDEAGDVRVELSLARDGAALVLDDPAGRQRVQLATVEQRLGLTVEVREGARVVLGLAADGPVLSLACDEAGNGLVATATDRGPGLRLVDEAGVDRVGLTVTDDGPALRMFNEKGRPGARLRVLPDEYGPALDFFDGEGGQLQSLP